MDEERLYKGMMVQETVRSSLQDDMRFISSGTTKLSHSKPSYYRKLKNSAFSLFSTMFYGWFSIFALILCRNWKLTRPNRRRRNGRRRSRRTRRRKEERRRRLVQRFGGNHHDICGTHPGRRATTGGSFDCKG